MIYWYQTQFVGVLKCVCAPAVYRCWPALSLPRFPFLFLVFTDTKKQVSMRKHIRVKTYSAVHVHTIYTGINAIFHCLFAWLIAVVFSVLFE